MKIGLHDVDGHNYPNIALMKLSAYYKNMGHFVDWYTAWGYYDIIFKSKIFTFTPDENHHVNCKKILTGGTGYYNNGMDNLANEIEHFYPDYSLYNTDKAYGFLTRGCPNNCSWCIVPQKEGDIIPNADINEFWNGQKIAILMDNNVIAHDHGLKQIEKIISLGIKVDFNQGLDARIIANNPEIAELLSKLKWATPLRMACDTYSQMEYVIKATELLRKYGTTPRTYFIYMLVKDIDDAHKRAIKLKDHNLDPFAQPYIDFRNNIMPTDKQRQFARWVNHKAIFKSVNFENYNPCKPTN